MQKTKWHTRKAVYKNCTRSTWHVPKKTWFSVHQDFLISMGVLAVGLLLVILGT